MKAAIIGDPKRSAKYAPDWPIVKETDKVFPRDSCPNFEGHYKNKEKKPYNAVVKIGEKGYIDFISFSK